ncbi:cyclodeaminase/cyclohydrolase family protein [Halorubrum sp. DTA98]|uniref:cyclodeaminase/cyclohydrolase family protein n=1 Tax=Halorubrum sp. DTA98 TaxID=3402163 RepID=UPI003AAC423E
MEYADHTIREFLSSVASEHVAPAGGTVAAVGGAFGTALCEMACIHTIETDGYADVVPELDGIETDLRRQRSHLLTLAEADASVVADSFASTADVPGETGMKRSVGVPLTIAEACSTVLELGATVTERCARSVVADARVGLVLVHAAIRAAVLVVRTNLERVSDAEFARRIDARLSAVTASSEAAFQRVDLHHG